MVLLGDSTHCNRCGKREIQSLISRKEGKPLYLCEQCAQRRQYNQETALYLR